MEADSTGWLLGCPLHQSVLSGASPPLAMVVPGLLACFLLQATGAAPQGFPRHLQQLQGRGGPGSTSGGPRGLFDQIVSKINSGHRENARSNPNYNPNIGTDAPPAAPPVFRAAPTQAPQLPSPQAPAPLAPTSPAHIPRAPGPQAALSRLQNSLSSHQPQGSRNLGQALFQGGRRFQPYYTGRAHFSNGLSTQNLRPLKKLN